MFQILKCSESMDVLINAIKLVLNIIRWAIPIVLIILGSIDMFKAMASSDDKKAGEAKKTFIRRLIYAVVAFLIPFLVTLAFDIVGNIVTNDGTDLHNENLSKGNFWVCWYKDGNSSVVNNNTYDEDSEEVFCCNRTDNGYEYAISDEKMTMDECGNLGGFSCKQQDR